MSLDEYLVLNAIYIDKEELFSDEDENSVDEELDVLSEDIKKGDHETRGHL